MKTDCEILNVDPVEHIRLGDLEVPCQQILVRDYDVPRSTFIVTLWGDYVIKHYNFQKGDNIKAEFILIAKRCNDGQLRNQQIKLLSATKHKPTWKPKGQSMDIYIIARADETALKVGRSSNVQKRLHTLQTSSNVPLTLLATYKGCGHLEAEIHSQLKSNNLHLYGEWFRYDPEVHNIVENICLQYNGLD